VKHIEYMEKEKFYVLQYTTHTFVTDLEWLSFFCCRQIAVTLKI